MTSAPPSNFNDPNTNNNNKTTSNNNTNTNTNTTDTDLTLEEISKIVDTYFSPSQFDEYLLDYIAKMIYTDRPENESDLKLLISDYLSDSLKYPDDIKDQICKEINNKLHKNGIKGVRKAIIAEKLKNPIRLCDVHVGSKNTITSLSFDPNSLTYQYEKFYAKGMETGDINNNNNNNGIFIISEEKKKAMKEFMDQQKREKEEIEIITLNHNKDESHKVDINVPTFTLHIGGKTLLDDATLKINFGHRYCLIGRNGIGKTTLLNHIVRKEIDGVPKNIQIVHVEQEIINNDNILIDEILSCDIERSKLLKESEEINKNIQKTNNNEKELKLLSEKLININKKLEEIDANQAENQAKFILLGLGFKEEDFKKKTKNFSGGWQMRIALAKALFVKPDLLLLDEPTNHLDMNAVMWLEDYLIKWPYTLVIVSHARDFIDNIATDVIHLQNQKLTYYKGNYTDFERTRAEMIKNHQKVHDAQQRKIEHMQEFIDKFRYKAKRAALVQSRIKQMNKMELVEEILEDPTCIFVFPEPDKINPPILRLDNADLGYDDKVIVEKINLNIDMSSRIALVGANGCGKTTLLKGLDGKINTMAGSCYRHSKLRLAVFAQHHIEASSVALATAVGFSPIPLIDVPIFLMIYAGLIINIFKVFGFKININFIQLFFETYYSESAQRNEDNNRYETFLTRLNNNFNQIRQNENNEITQFTLSQLIKATAMRLSVSAVLGALDFIPLGFIAGGIINFFINTPFLNKLAKETKEFAKNKILNNGGRENVLNLIDGYKKSFRELEKLRDRNDWSRKIEIINE